jgi:hypothetical protein
MKRRDALPDFTRAEWQVLQRLQFRYQEDHDLLTTHEVARLRFVRWLVATGRLDSDGPGAKEGGARWRM